MEKRFQVKRFQFETTSGGAVCRFILTNRLLPFADIAAGFVKIVEKLESGCYNE